MLHIFYIAYRLTGDEAWLEKGRRGMNSALSQTTGLPLLKFGNDAAFYNEAFKRGWFCDDRVSLTPYGWRAVNRTYALPTFEWEKFTILYEAAKNEGEHHRCLMLIPLSPRNPEVSPELECEVAFFLKWGYLVMKEAAAPKQVETLRVALDETFHRNNSGFTHRLSEEDERFRGW